MPRRMSAGNGPSPGDLKFALQRSGLIRQIRPWAGLLRYYAGPPGNRVPKLVNIEVTNRCNLRCGRCWFHGTHGVGDRYAGRELTTGELFRLIDQLTPCRPRIYLGGAEPLMREDFFSLLEYIKKNGLYVFFTTNGLLWDTGKIRRLVALAADSVSFSIDGGQELHDREKGHGSFRETTAVIREIGRLKTEWGTTIPAITVNVAITADTAGHLREAIDEVKKATNNGVDLFVMHHLWYVTAEELAGHRSDVTQSLGGTYSAPGAASHLIPGYLPLNPYALAAEVSGLLDGTTVTSHPLLDARGIVNFYSNSAARHWRKRCIAPFFGALVKPNGDVVLCPDEWVDDFVTGNVRAEDFDAIWHGDAAKRFRRALLKRGYFSGCKRCSWMYSF
jgi:radical SAM protein with 4Fe4S-binding SPASM domain